MKFLFLSVKHSGLHTCRNHIFQDYESKYAHFEEHTTTELQSMANGCDDIIVPIRNPMAVAQSWTNRGYKMRPLVHGLARMVLFPNTMLLPVDALNRDFFLKRIENKHDITLKKSWPKLNHHDGPAEKMDSAVVQEMSAFLKLNFFKDIYGPPPAD